MKKLILHFLYIDFILSIARLTLNLIEKNFARNCK